MKKVYPFIASMILMVLMSHIMAGQEQEKIHLKVITLLNGEKKILEKTYESMEEIKRDPEFRALDIDITDINREKIHDMHSSDTARTEYKEIKIKKSGTSDDKHEVVVVKMDSMDVDRDVEVEEEVIKIITRGEEGESVQTITKEIDGKQYVIKTHEDEGSSDHEKRILVTKKKMGDEVEIEQEVEVIKDEEGHTKVIINGEEVEVDALHELSIDSGTEVVVFNTKSNNDLKEVEKKVHVLVKEIDDTRHIEIRIEETRGLNVHIANIEEDDKSLSELKYVVKNDLEALELNYYPNPNNGHFSLKFRNGQRDPVQIKILDFVGKEIFSEESGNFQGELDKEINIEGQEKGLYILQITQKGKALSRKIVVE